MSDNKLTRLDFAPGIKASKINNNFDVVHNWILDERRRLGGTGIVEGFDTTVDTKNFTVTISSGTYISKDGEEHHVDGHTFQAGEPEYIKRTEKYICPKDGCIKLPVPPYSPATHGYIRYIPPEYAQVPDDAIFMIVCEAENNSRVFFTQIDDETIYISRPDAWANKELTFTYYASANRVDSILLNQDGTYTYQKSIVSDSPSHVDLGDYETGVMLLSVVEWIVGRHIDSRVYTDHRSYRNIFVNEDAELYLNGRRYRDAQQIYMTEPEEPQPNDIWYDAQNNCLMVWRKQFGDWGWVLINDSSSTMVRSHKIWTPQDFPGDNMTFLFGNDEMDLNYVPGTNSLEIIIDNAVLMSDQYEEITTKADNAPSYMAAGIGFKLKDPLDRATYVECIVNHQVKSKPTTDTFQRAAVFVSDGFSYFSTSNKEHVFVTKYPYTIGANQLEVWVNGVRLNYGRDFVEMTDENTIATVSSNGQMSSYFKIQGYPLVENACVAYRVSKYLWNYDQVAELMKNTFDDVSDVKAQCESFRKDITNLNAHIATQFDTLAKSIDNVRKDSSADRPATIQNGQVMLAHLNSSVRAHMLNRAFSLIKNVTELKPIAGVKSSDFMIITIFNNSETKTLIPNIDYTLSDTSDGLRVNLISKYMASTYSVYISGIVLGV